MQNIAHYRKSNYKQQKQKCRFYAQGRCHYGQNCRYNHQGYKQFYIMRHAQSIFNSLCDKLQGQSFQSQKAKIQFQLNPNIIDCGLTQIGKQQIINTELPKQSYRLKKKKHTQELIKVKYIDLVFVSPLNRALETAQLLLKNNQIRYKKVIVLPELTQVVSKVCDFSGSVIKKKQLYPRFDFQHLQQTQHLFQKSQIKQNQNTTKFWQDQFIDFHHFPHLIHEQNHGKRYMKILQQIFPTPLESSQRCFQRTIIALKKIQQITKKQQGKKILIISHNRILKYMCGKDNGGRAPSLLNCEIRKIMLEDQ